MNLELLLILHIASWPINFNNLNYNILRLYTSELLILLLFLTDFQETNQISKLSYKDTLFFCSTFILPDKN